MNNPEMIGEPMSDPQFEVGEPVKRNADEARQAQSAVPAVAQRPAPIIDLAQQITFAQAMAKANSTIPASFRGNVGDCLAIVDIALRAGLSPYMLAGKCYVEPKSGRMAMESQAYHALAQTPGILKGDLTVDYEGEGEDLVCIVRGRLASDPGTVREHRSEPLHKARPPKNQEGVVKGSPLWVKKPRVQLFYDTSRDWVRLYAPRATLGIYTRDELEEYSDHFGPDNAKLVGPDLKERFNGADRSEGHKAGHVDAELANIAGNTNQPPEKEPKKKTKAEKAPKPEKPAKKEKPPKENAPPKTAAQYADYCSAWIEKETDRDNAEARWEVEFDMRTELSVPIRDRNELRAKLDSKFGDSE